MPKQQPNQSHTELKPSTASGIPAVLPKTMPCPVCSYAAFHPKLRQHAFVESKHDVDLRPEKFKWLLKDIQPVNPLMFWVWGCPTCGFASANTIWDKPWKGTTLGQRRFQQVYKLLLQTDSKARRLVDELHPDCSESRTYLDAFELTIIALFLCLQIEEFVVSETIVPARYYLRLAWFLREAGGSKEEPIVAGELQDILGSVQEFWPDAPTSERECRQRAIDLYSKALTSSRSIETARDEVELILLIGRLYMSLGDIKQARAFIDRARSSTRKFEQQKIVSHARGVPESSVAQMGSDLRTMERMSEDVSTLFDDIKAEVREAQYKLAEPLLRAHTGKSPRELREILEANGVELEFALEFAPDPKPQPKGFFGGLFGN